MFEWGDSIDMESMTILYPYSRGSGGLPPRQFLLAMHTRILASHQQDNDEYHRVL